MSQELIAKCDSLIKAGHAGAVARLIGGLVLSKIPRADRGPLAKICRRSGLINQGLRILFPILRNGGENQPPTESELCEYAVLLSRNGSIREALNLLDQIANERAPEVLLARAFCHISEWNYSAAIPLLESYLRAVDEPYARLMARVNLAASYLAVEKIEGTDLFLNETIGYARAMNATRLVGNAYEQLAHFHYLRQDLSSMSAALDKAMGIFRESDTYDRLLVAKWQALLLALGSRSVQPLEKFRHEAVRRAHWESVREADLFMLSIHFDQKKFDHLYYGSPVPSYRGRLSSHFPSGPSDHYVLGSPNPKRVLHLGEGSGKIHELLRVLARDFYIPCSTGAIFAEIYPGEFYNVQSSPLRVRQLLHRVRGWIADEGLSVSVKWEKPGYRLAPFAQTGLRVDIQTEVKLEGPRGWADLEKAFPPGSYFTAAEACTELKISRSTFLRLSRWALDQGRLSKTGLAEKVRYEMTTPHAKSA